MSTESKAYILEDGDSFRLQRDAWFNDYPLSDLPMWLAFYRRLRAQHAKAAGSYDETIAALEALAAQTGAQLEG